jgi:hypothetical protein
MIVCNSFGMLSKGVRPPDRRFIVMNTGRARSPNWGMERARVAKKIPSAVTENR